jgi:hypothetical protein
MRLEGAGMLRRLSCVVLLGLLLVGADVWNPTPAAAEDDYDDKDFSLRLASAFVRFRDVLTAGGLTAANRWPSVINPASAAWSCPPGPCGVSLAGYESPIWFDEGPDLNVVGLGANVRTPLGTLQPAGGLIRSGDSLTRQGLTFDYEVEFAQLSWAQRFQGAALGASVNYAQAKTGQDLGPVTVFDSDADSWRVRLGALHEPCCRWLIGVTAEYGWADFQATTLAIGPFGPVPVQLDETDRQTVAQVGVSYAYGDYSSVYADYNYGRFWSDDRGTLQMHRFSFGVDHQALDFLFVRPQITVDGRGNFEAALGLSVQFAKWGGIDLAWKYDAFPELRREFGRSNTLQIMLNLRF